MSTARWQSETPPVQQAAGPAASCSDLSPCWWLAALRALKPSLCLVNIASVLCVLITAGAQTNSVNVTLKSTYQSPGTNSWRAYDIAVVGNYAYVPSDREGLLVLDVSDPANPMLAGIYHSSTFVTGVDVQGRYAYVTDETSSDFGMHVIDVSDPANPTEAGGYRGGPAFEVRVAGNYAYLGDALSGSLSVVGVGNPTNCVIEGSCVTGGSSTPGIDVMGHYAYVAAYDAGLRVIDINDPRNPVRVGAAATGLAWDVHVVGNYAYVANEDTGLKVVDVSNPTNCVEVGGYGGRAFGVHVSGNYAYVFLGDGLQIIDVSNPTNCVPVGGYGTNGNWVGRVDVAGNLIFVARENLPLLILDSGPSFATAPVIHSQPAPSLAEPGGSASFFVAAKGSVPLSYQWLFQGTNIPGATQALLILTNLQFDQSGQYSVVVSNSVGVTFSSSARLGIEFNLTGSLLVQAFPSAPPAHNGNLLVTNDAGGQWHFPWELGWRNAGEAATNLLAASYDIQFRRVLDRLPYPPTVSLDVTNNGTTLVTNADYYPTLPFVLGSITVNIGPNPPSGAGWRFRGEAAWRAAGSTASGLLPDTYTIEFATLGGWSAPDAFAVQSSGNNLVPPTVNYHATQATTNTALPVPLADLSYINSSLTNTPRLPYAFSGQLQSDLGFASGVAARSNVVLTAAHVVFDDSTLSYVNTVYWFFQKQAGEFDPNPMTARGWYVLSGYAAARTNDLPPIGTLSPGVSSAQSRTWDVAALYFQSTVARGGFGGYLSSDAATNEWLTGSYQKMLVGYPVDASAYGYTNVIAGKMHATPATNYSFALQNGRVYASADFLGFPGNSGGPLCVLYTNNNFYPAAVYIGTAGNLSVVRAIDSDVVNIISQAGALGDAGTNNTGGGVITITSGQAASRELAYLEVQLGPPAALAAGGGWRLQGASAFLANSDFVRTFITNGTETLEFGAVPGWYEPPTTNVTVATSKLAVVNAQYVPIPLPHPPVQLTGARLVANRAITMTLSGVTGRVYSILVSTNVLTPLTNWTELLCLTNTTGQTNFTDPFPATNAQRYYRAKELP